MKSIKIISVTILTLCLVQKARAQEVDTVSLPADLQLVLDNYEKYWQTHDAHGLASLFTEDGFILRPGHPPVRGRNNIAKAYEGSGGGLHLVAYDYQQEGNSGFIIGGYSGNPSTPPSGKFTLTLKKVDGKWLIHSDMDNGNTRMR